MRPVSWIGTSLFLTFVAVITPSITAEPGQSPTRTPAGEGQLSERERSLLLQLADDEANIRELNVALVRTGYKVGLAYDRIETNEKGNEHMDRNGGGPVRWDTFYGRTAKEYNRNGTNFDRRPQQFDFIYKANADQITKAKGRVASLAQDQATLLARRQKHEADQVYLWAALAWGRVEDREIAFQPLYRFKLKPSGTRAAILRGPILFLRRSDKATANSLATVESDPENTFADMGDQIKDAYAGLQESMATATFVPEVRSADRDRAAGLKAACKQLMEQCAVTADNWRKALESDRNNEDSSKLRFRAELQASLMKFAASSAELDEQIRATAAAWAIAPEIGADSPDTLSVVVPKETAADKSREVVKAPTSTREDEADGPSGTRRLKAGRTLDLLARVDTGRDAIRGTWAVEHGELRPLHCDDDHGPFIELPAAPNGSYLLRIEFEFLNGSDALYVHLPVATTWGVLAIGHQKQDFFEVHGIGGVGGAHAITEGHHQLVAEVTQSRTGEAKIAVSVDQHEVIRWSGPFSAIEHTGDVWMSRNPSAFAIDCKTAVFKSITLEMVAGDAKVSSPRQLR